MLQLSPLATQVEKEQHDRLSRMANSQNEALANLNDYLEILQSEVYVDLDRLRLLARHGIPNELRAVCFYMSIRHRDRHWHFYNRRFGNISWVFNKPTVVSNTLSLSLPQDTKNTDIHHHQAKELSNSKARKEDYEQLDKQDPEIAKRIRGEVARYQRRVPLLDGRQHMDRFENVILAYLSANRDAEYHPALISLCAPFVYVLDQEWDAYYCFEKLMQALGKEPWSCLVFKLNSLPSLEEHYTTHNIKENMAKFMTLFRHTLPDL